MTKMQAAKILGSEGGKTTGKTKVRTPEQCRKAALTRWRFKTIQERFWAKVAAGKRDECWPWIASTKGNGYGQFRVGSKEKWAHRVAYELNYGEFDPKLDVCHRCDNPICCNPNHLFLGTAKDNIRDCRNKGRSNDFCKLTKGQVEQIRKDHVPNSRHASYSVLAKRFGVSVGAIGHVVRGTTWRRV